MQIQKVERTGSATDLSSSEGSRISDLQAAEVLYENHDITRGNHYQLAVQMCIALYTY